MKRIFMLAVVLLLFSGFALRLQPVTTYIDNTAIEPAIGIFYDAWIDNAVLAAMVPQATPWVYIPLSDNTFGATHIYRARTHLSDGRLSADYIVTLTSPLDGRLPKAPDATQPAAIVPYP